MMKVILASASPRRKKLLSSLQIDFTIHPSGASEEVDGDLSPEEIVTLLAKRKAEDVFRHYSDQDAFIIAADTIVCLEGRIIGKPADLKEAEEILRSLSGRVHEVWTALHTIHTPERKSFSLAERTFVTFGSLYEPLLRHYLATESPLDKAGAYGIQDDAGALFVRNIEGDYNNVVGFPLYGFFRHVKQHYPELTDTLFFNAKPADASE